MYSVNPLESFSWSKSTSAGVQHFLLMVLCSLSSSRTPFPLKKWREYAVFCPPYLLVYNSPHRFNTSFKKLSSAIEDSNGFTEYMRVPHIKFIELFNVISPFTQNKDIQNFKYECLFSLVRSILSPRYVAQN